MTSYGEFKPEQLPERKRRLNRHRYRPKQERRLSCPSLNASPPIRDAILPQEFNDNPEVASAQSTRIERSVGV